MSTILYPYGIPVTLADSKGGPTKTNNKGGNGNGIGPGGGNGVGKGKGQGGGGKPSGGGGGGMEPPVTANLLINYDAQDTSKIFADTGKTTPITAGTEVQAIDQTDYLGDDAVSGAASYFTWEENVINTYPVFRANSINDDLGSNFTALNTGTDGLTIFLVYDNFSHASAPVGQYRTLAHLSGASAEGLSYFGSFSLRGDSNSLTTNWVSPVNNGQNLIYCQLFNGDVEISVNAGTISGNTTTNGRIIASVGLGGTPYTGVADYGQLLMYKGTLSDTDRDAMITWLSDRWGLGFV